MSKIKTPIEAINLNQLAALAKVNPKYTKMFAGLSQIDNLIKKFVEDTICNYADPSVYYIKTELMAQCYTIYLYNSERESTIGATWPLAEFLTKCESKTIEYDVISKTKQMLNKFGQAGLSTDKINWIY